MQSLFDLKHQTEDRNFDIEITPKLLERLRSELLEVFDVAGLDAAHRKRVALAGRKEYSWVYRPEIPLLIQAVRDFDSWIEALEKRQEPHNSGALGPFVRLGLALRFARGLPGGAERLHELHQLSLAADFPQLTNKAFEIEAAFYLSETCRPAEVAFGPLGGNPDLWLGQGLGQLPVECKVVSGGSRPSRQCLGQWRKFIVWAVEAMERHNVSAGICVRARDNFSSEAQPILTGVADELLAELATVDDESWALRSHQSGDFLVYGVRLCEWGRERPPFHVPLGLDGDVSVRIVYDTAKKTLLNPYFFALKFQQPAILADAIFSNFRAAASQLKRIRSDGPGLVVLKVNALRAGDLFEVDTRIRQALVERTHVSAVLLLADQSGYLDTAPPADGVWRWGFTLKPYLIVNGSARVRVDWPDSKATYFPSPPLTVVRNEHGELVPFDFEEERRLLESGTVLTPVGNESPVLLNARDGKVPPMPHIVPESAGMSEVEDSETLWPRFSQPIRECLLPVDADRVLLEWLVIGRSHFRIFRDRYLNLRVNRRTPTYQDNVAIDLVPFGHADELLLQLAWTADGVTASLRWSDDYPAAVCRSVRSRID